MRFADYYCNYCYHAGDDPCPVHRKSMERRFVIKECSPTGAPHDFSISESELRWRLSVILGFRHDWKGDEEINILLHGKPTPDVPIPKPTRKDWEEWAWDLAGTLSTSVEHRLHINQLLLTMPGVPKAVPPAKS